MKKILLSLCIAALSVCPAAAENWIPVPSDSPAFIDTDSYTAEGDVATIRMKEDFGKGPVLFTLAFRTSHRTYKTMDIVLPGGEGGKEIRYDDHDWQPVRPGTFGKNLYTHFIENPIPHFDNPRWLAVWHEQKQGGATLYLERSSLSYRDGYAMLYFKVAKPDKSGGLIASMYHVKMNMAYKKVQALSLTDYGTDGRITAHGAGSRTWANISPGTPMAKLYDYINGELTSGRLPNLTRRA